MADKILESNPNQPGRFYLARNYCNKRTFLNFNKLLRRRIEIV